MPPRIGILAGGGEFPKRLIEACKADGQDPFVIAFEGNADRDTVANVAHCWVRIGAIGRIFAALKDAGVGRVVMTGRFNRPSWRSARPDLRGLTLLPKALARPQGDDSMLRFAIELLEGEGLEVVGVETILPDVIAEEGPLGRQRPDKIAEKDIERGIAVATLLGSADVGQSVIVQQGIVLGVEAIEGTDALMERCGGLRREGHGGVLVKLCKPGQDRRVDLPTIGAATLRHAADAGLRGIAVQAGATLIADKEDVRLAADAAGLFVIGVHVAS